MDKYDLIVVGTGSAMNYIDHILQDHPGMKIAVIDRDEPGGICLTRACIPSKLLLYPAELIRNIQRSAEFGIDARIENIDFRRVMEDMRGNIGEDIELIRQSLIHSDDVDYFRETAEFVAPYTMKVGDQTISAKKIFLCTGSRPSVPPVKGLDKINYHTSDSIINLTERPSSILIIGGGYVAAEYGHFFSSMGTQVTIVGRNPFLLPGEEREISVLARKVMSRYMDIWTNHEIVEIEDAGDGQKKTVARDRDTGDHKEIIVDEILVATGRTPNSDILHPDKGGIETDDRGWIKVNEYLETSMENVWAMGDCNGKYLFKHVGNYESMVVYYNAFKNKKIKTDYHAVPHAVFSHPEIAGVGMAENEVISAYGRENVIIGFSRFEDTAKGQAMKVRDYFVKVILTKDGRIVGAHIIGPQASVLIHEIIPLMYTLTRSADPIMRCIDIHPSLSEVVRRAFYSLAKPQHYHHILEHMGLEGSDA